MQGKAEQRKQAYKTVFNTEAGSDVLHDLAKVCNAYTTSHVQGDPAQTALNEGKRAVYLYIMKVLESQNEIVHRNYLEELSRDQLIAIQQQENALYD